MAKKNQCKRKTCIGFFITLNSWVRYFDTCIRDFLLTLFIGLFNKRIVLVTIYISFKINLYKILNYNVLCSYCFKFKLIFTQFRFVYKFFNFLNHITASAIKRYSFMQACRFNFHYSGNSIRSFSTCLFCYKGHWITFIQKS
jgi:hypothetical protein